MWAPEMSSPDAEIPGKSKYLYAAMLAPNVSAGDLINEECKGHFSRVSEERKCRRRDGEVPTKGSGREILDSTF